MTNRWLRGIVYVGIGMAVLIPMFFLGDVITRASIGSAEFWAAGTHIFGPDGWTHGWALYVLIGALVVLLIYYALGEGKPLKVSSRELILSFLGAVLYASLTYIFNVVSLPGAAPIALRPAVVIPIFFGFAFGPVVGFFTGALGNILGDSFSGWGVYPIWDIGNGLIGFIPGLMSLCIRQRSTVNKATLGLSILVMGLGTILTLIKPVMVDPYTGEVVNLGFLWAVVGITLLLLILIVWQPRLWPYVSIVMVLGVLAFSGVDIAQNGIGLGSVAIWMVVLIIIGAMVYLHRQTGRLARWMSESEIRDIVLWGTMGIIVGILYAALADIPYNGLSLEEAFVGEFIPTAVANVIFAIGLAPLLYGVWQQAQIETSTAEEVVTDNLAPS